MIMKSGEHWTCSHPACQRAVVAESSGEIAGSNPQCACGSAMKEVYSPRVFRYLDFLRFGHPEITPSGSRED